MVREKKLDIQSLQYNFFIGYCFLIYVIANDTGNPMILFMILKLKYLIFLSIEKIKPK